MPALRLEGDVRPALSSLVAIASFMALVLTVACLSWGRAFLVPMALATVLTFLLEPIVDVLQRARLHRAIAVILVVLITGLLLFGLGWLLVAQVASLADELRRNAEYRKTIQQKIDDLRVAGKGGFLDNLQGTVDEITGQLAEGGPDEKPGSKKPIVVEAQPTSAMERVRTVLEPLSGSLGTAALVSVLVIFMLLKHEDLRDRLISLAGAGRLTTTTRAMAEAGQRVSKYLLMQLIVNASYGLALGLGLFLIGVPYALLWGFLAAILRYIPYVGPWAAALFPVVISLVAFPGWARPALVVGLFLGLELLSNMVMEPWLYGQSIGVSAVALLVAAGFWTWLWGPVGLILATPLTVCIIVLGRHVPQLRFFMLLLGDAPALESHASYYQRLLARDEDEATKLVEGHAREHGLDSVYDDVLIPAILLAAQDRKNGELDIDDEAFILQATRQIVDDAFLDQQATSKEGEETRPALDAATRPVLIFGSPAHQEAEEVIVQMLRNLMPPGYLVEVLSTKTSSSELVSRIQHDEPALVFIAVLPGGLPQARYQCQLLRKHFPEMHVLVGYWGKKEDFDKVLVRLRQAGAGSLTTSLGQSRSRILSLTEPSKAIQGKSVA